jgi:hypothetical protein
VNELELQLLRETGGDKEPTLTIQSQVKIDAGRWWRKTPLWLCVVGHDLVLLAVARRRYAEKIAIADCLDSHYNAATGELVIAPAENLRFDRIKVSPRQAIQLLKFLNPQSVSKALQH